MIILNKNLRIKRAIEAIDVFIEKTQSNNFNYSGLRDGIYHAFYSNRQIYEDFKEVFPSTRIGEIDGFLRNFTSQSGYALSDLPKMRESLTNIKHHLLTEKVSSLKIFYSWQSDSANNTNRGFIEKTLDSSIKEINIKYNLNIELDSDTRGEPGSPDISNTILEKIRNSFIFVGDVSYVAHLGNKGMPNSNVMFELGYAMSVLTDKNVIMVFNESSGELNKMPFDLGLKRQLVFSCSETDNQKATERKKLTNQLTSRIEAILKSNDLI
ncbi:hypothetical protein ACF3MZ_11100 [Paenibacillaceae bacterium WGS1546]|uniref:hypothetical protein n=1 Tax=Cohnella sp. WGS1546 TaxID=3366810 RepID=UPI00372D1F33